MKKLNLIIALLIMSAIKVSAQDFHLSMYDAGPINLNPALTGVVDAQWRVHAQYRSQWKSVAFKPYNTSLISFDAPVGKWGFGGQISNMRAGIGNYNALQGLASVAYSVSLDKHKYNNISFGVQGGITQKTLEYKLYTFDNQYTSANGGGFSQDIASGETFNSQKAMLPQVNAGFMYFMSKMQSHLNPFFGISAYNLTQPKETFLGTSNVLPMRYYMNAGLRISFTEQFYVLPKILIMNQQNNYEYTYAMDLGYYLTDQKTFLLGGVMYRNNDAVIFSLGARVKDVIAKVSYDVNTSSLARVSNGKGAFEVAVTYMPRSKSKSKLIKACPRI